MNDTIRINIYCKKCGKRTTCFENILNKENFYCKKCRDNLKPERIVQTFEVK